MTQNALFPRSPEVATFTLTSTDISDGAPLAPVHYSAAFGVPGGEDRSPQLSWSGAPEGTRSYAVTVHDPDAPTQSGFWHWIAVDIPATVTEIASGASPDALPEGTLQLKGDAGVAQFIGAAPPAGHGAHRYVVTVHALDVETLDVPAEASPALAEFTAVPHTLARATIVATGEIPAE